MDNQLRKIRRARNLTLHTLGDLVGLSHTAIQRYEVRKKGEKGAIFTSDVQTLLKLGEVLKVTVMQILGQEPFPAPEKKGIDEARMGEVVEVITRYALENSVVFRGKIFNKLQFAIYEYCDYNQIETSEINSVETLERIKPFVRGFDVFQVEHER